VLYYFLILEFSGGFSLDILSFALRISESAMGRGWEFKFSGAFIVIPVSWRMKMREV
jgi:hypothetical protein